jgi:hypothetical protein
MYPTQFVTLGLLAAAYRGGRANLKNMRTHSVGYKNNDISDWDGNKTLCGLVPLDHMADVNSSPEGIHEKPTCKKCLRYDPRFIVYATPILFGK